MAYRNQADEIKALQAELAALKAKRFSARPFSLKVSEKGAVSAYGIGRFPVTLYRSQWEMLLAHAKDVSEFIAAHRAELASKD